MIFLAVIIYLILFFNQHILNDIYELVEN
jgi:hypothetical protein